MSADAARSSILLLTMFALGCSPAARAMAADAPSSLGVAESEAPPKKTKPMGPAWSRAESPHDEVRTASARDELLAKLRSLASFDGFALGHQDSTAYGVGWNEESDRSDVAGVCGSHVAVHGWDLFGIERGNRDNGDGVNFARMQTLIRQAYEAGGINTISFHVDNPLTQGNAWDTRAAASAALPTGSAHAIYRGYLDRLAEYLDGLRGAHDERIPVLLRLLHEHNGDWFWWGSQNDEDDYRALLRFSIDYLRTERGLDHLLFAFSPDGGRIQTAQDQLYGYPGDEFVDVIGVDYYFDPGQDRLIELMEHLVSAAETRGKIPALTEFGPRDGVNRTGIEDDFLSTRVVLPLLDSSQGRRLAYILAWRNDRADHAFLPYPGHRDASDLKKVCALPQVLLSRDMSTPVFSR